MKYYKLIKKYPSIPKEVSIGVIVEHDTLKASVKMKKDDKFIFVNKPAFIDYYLREGELMHEDFWIEVEKPIKNIQKESYTVEEILEISNREGLNIKSSHLYLIR